MMRISAARETSIGYLSLMPRREVFTAAFENSEIIRLQDGTSRRMLARRTAHGGSSNDTSSSAWSHGMDPKSILVVDDDVDTCRNLVDLLQEFGYRVDAAHDGNGALNLAKQKHYRLALLDLRLPGMNGLDVFRRIRDTCHAIDGILMTGFATQDVVIEGIQCGLRRVLAKPVEIPELLTLIDEIVAQPE